MNLVSTEASSVQGQESGARPIQNDARHCGLCSMKPSQGGLHAGAKRGLTPCDDEDGVYLLRDSFGIGVRKDRWSVDENDSELA